MINKIKLIFINNISIKILSFVIAIFLWVISMRVNNLVVSKTYSLPIELINTKNLVANNFILLNEKAIKDNKINIQVQATRNDLRFISKNTSNLRANIDFKNIDSSYRKYIGNKISLPVNISFSSYLNSSRYQILKVYPSEFDIELDNFINTSEKIYYETNGEPAQNYYIKNIIITPDNIEISGAESIIKLIKPIFLNLDTAGINKNISTKMPIKIYDKDNNDWTNNLNLDEKEAHVFIEVDSYKKIIIEKPETFGKVADGFVLKNIDYEPKEIEITGDKKTEIKSLKLPAININQTSLSKTISYDLNDLLINSGVQIKKGANDKILIKINIEKAD